MKQPGAVPAPELEALRVRIGNLLPGASVFVSSMTEDGLDPLRRALLAAARKGTEIAEISFPESDGKLLAEIYRGANVISQRTEDGKLFVNARVDDNIAERRRRAGAKVARKGN